MRVLLHESYGAHGSRGDVELVEPMVGLAVRLRALQARGAAMPMRAPPDFAELLARDGASPVTTGVMLAMSIGGWL